jgi:polyphosphate kinase 2 (PPK2 family)
MDAAKRFLEVTPEVERAFAESGIIIMVKYRLEVSPEEQTRRLEARIDDPRKIWKLSPMDLMSYSRWHDYSRARDDMFKGDPHRCVRDMWCGRTTRGAPGSTRSRIFRR